MSKEPLILVSNDDGVYSEGLINLKESLSTLGRVVVVAPSSEMSAVSRSFTLHKKLRVKEIKDDFWEVAGTPTDCVYIALHHILKEQPDIVVSGINRGPNLGHDVFYSGTVAVAFEACFHKINSFAISLTSKKDFDFKKAGFFARFATKRILEKGLPNGVILNINVPSTKDDNFSYKITTLGENIYTDIIEETHDLWGNKYFTISGKNEGYVPVPESDCESISNNIISVTPLSIIPNHVKLEEFKNFLGSFD